MKKIVNLFIFLGIVATIAAQNPSFSTDFGKGKIGSLPGGWSLTDFENVRAPRFQLKKDAQGTYLSITGNGDPAGVAYLSSKTQLTPGTYTYKALFSISKDVNPQRNLLFQCKASSHDGIFKFYRLDKGMVEGRGTIVVTGDKSVDAQLRVFYRFNTSGEVKLRSLSLTPTEPIQPRWVRFGCTEGRLKIKDIAPVAEQAAKDKVDLLLYPEANDRAVVPGTKTDVFKTDFGTVGMIICYDSWFTDVTELFALKGAEVILFPVAAYYRSLIHARAADNSVRFVISVLGGKYGMFDTAGRDIQNPNKDSSVGARGNTFKDIRTFDVNGFGLLCADLDLNCSPSPHYNGGKMLKAPGGKRNKAEQILYLEDQIKNEKERWWENNK
ncbi:MAG: carbon-nitrogen hydrolase family protein [Prevotellaceae bacterium]|nr:carbon-nitrogen hydrolase family protein [Prevotellaceae bacterium]